MLKIREAVVLAESSRITWAGHERSGMEVRVRSRVKLGATRRNDRACWKFLSLIEREPSVTGAERPTLWTVAHLWLNLGRGA